MRTFSRPVILAILAALTVAASGAEDDAKRSKKPRVLNGIYTSGFQNGPQRLRAEFFPGPDETPDRWRVKFHFRWSGADRTYSGEARGSLASGPLHGQVTNEDQTRVFVFRCEFDKKKRCKGRHAERVPTGEHDTGTITLKE